MPGGDDPSEKGAAEKQILEAEKEKMLGKEQKTEEETEEERSRKRRPEKSQKRGTEEQKRINKMADRKYWTKKALSVTAGTRCGEDYGRPLPRGLDPFHYRTISSSSATRSIHRFFSLRMALYGSLICAVLALLVGATLLVVLSPGCGDAKAGAGENATGAPGYGALKGEGAPEEGKLMRGAKQLAPLLAPLVSPSQLSVPEGESAYFRCEYPGNKVRWSRVGPGGQNLEPVMGGDEELEQYPDGTLHIRKAKKSHQGEYLCEGRGEGAGGEGGEWHGSDRVRLVVYNSGGGSEQEREQPRVEEARPAEPDLLLPPALPPLLSPSRPLPPPPPPAPTQILPPAVRPRVDTYLKLATAGEPVHFRCWMAGKSSDELQWRRLGDQQEPREGVGTAGEGISLLAKTEPDGHSAFLIFGAVKETDAGEYECVDRGTGIASSLVRLRIEPARSPVIDPMEQSVPEGSTAQLHCSVPGHPDAQLMWRRENGVEVGTVEGTSDDGRGTLRIGGARKEHERMGWVCWAIYSQRADKQALSAGPALIRVVPSQVPEPEGEPMSGTTPEGEKEAEGSDQKGGKEQPEPEGTEPEKGAEEEADQIENDQQKGGEDKPKPEPEGAEEADRTAEENDQKKPESEPTEIKPEEGGKEADQTEERDRKGGEEQSEEPKPTETENTTGIEPTESVGADLNPTEPTQPESADDQSTTEIVPIDQKSTNEDEADKNPEDDKEGNALAEISENLFTP